MDLYKKFGVLPIGDTGSWSGASWPWWYHSSEEVEARWEQKPIQGWNYYFNGVISSAKEIKKYSEDPTLKLTDIYTPVHSGEPMIPVIESIACDIPRVLITNILNTEEYVAGVHKDFEVEIPTLVSRKGVQGIKTNGLPNSIIAHILRDRVAPVELELEAFNQGSKDLLVQLVLTDKWAKCERQVMDFIDEIISLEYHGEMKNHYKWR